MPTTGKLLVRPVQTPELVGRIVLPEATRDAWTWGQMEVLAIGASAWCDDPDCERSHEWHHLEMTGYDRGILSDRHHSHGLVVGAWVLVKPRALTETLTDGEYLCQQDDVLAILTP